VNRGKFIVCEGLDASGKTTSARHAIRELGGKYYISYSKGLMTDTPAGRLSRLYPSTLTLLTELLYIDRRIVRPDLDEGYSVIQDRWYDSVLFHNPDNPADRILERVCVPWLTEPDLLVGFTVSLGERIRRMEKRMDEHDRILLEDPQKIIEREERFMERFEWFDGEKEMIDTTDLTEEEAGYMLCQAIDIYLSGKPQIIPAFYKDLETII